ncbi:hypothetical protein BIV25_21065 [Streptomyces sp. MUSC 14]|nr:hypothetical protein BIV25_21065 [Streptomyces sp. MUSC 14]
MHCLARDAGISQATGCRYLNEGIDLHDVLARCRREAMKHAILDGSLIERQRPVDRPEAQGVRRQHPFPVRSGRHPAARIHALSTLHKAAAEGLQALGESTAAELKRRWRTLQYVTLSPSRIGDVARTALALNGIR